MVLQATNVQDITFRAMDVVVIVSGIISVLGSFFYLRFQASSTAKELDAYMKTNDKEMEKLEAMIEKHGEVTGEFKEKIFRKLEEQGGEMHKLALSIADFKNEILKELKK